MTQEAERGTGEGRQQQHRGPAVTELQRDRQQAHAGYRCDAAGQAVQAVDEVESVGEANDPQQGHQDGERLGYEHVTLTAEVVGDELDPDAVEQDRKSTRLNPVTWPCRMPSSA